MSIPVALLLGILVNCIWGFAFLVPHLLSQVDPVLLTLGRYLCYGAVSAVILATWRGASLGFMTRADWRMALALAFTGNVGYYALVVVAIQLGGVPIAALVIGTLPVTMAVIGNLAQREFPFRVLLPSIALILSGLVLLNGHALTRADDDVAAARTAWGLLAAIGALCLWTWYGIRNAQYMKAHRHIDANAWSVAIGLATAGLSLAALPLVLAAHAVVPAVDLAVLDDARLLAALVAASLFLGIVVSWLATVLWNRVARVLPVAMAGQLVVFETLSSLVYAFVADGRWPQPVEFGSAALILGGVVFGIRATLRRGDLAAA
ncbi:DMT family transporter [Salinarimonas chemoclinalis]|uniref:DMT family transporter n=1 Tax=Salinarimonas chemoclinalis TaxID=3241599 RepID=UPI0035570540